MISGMKKVLKGSVIKEHLEIRRWKNIDKEVISELRPKLEESAIPE